MKDDYFVAPHTLRSNTDLRNPEKKIDLYEKRLFGWFIDIAKALKVNPGDPNGGPGADPASLLIAMSLFEPLGVYLQGENAPIHTKSGEPKARENFEYSFRHFLEKIHSELSKAQREEIAEWVYIQVRCGLFHLSTAKRGIWYDRGTNSQPTPSMAVKRYARKITRITFNVPAFLLEVDTYFKEYVSELRVKNSEKRKRFLEGWIIIIKSLRQTP